MVTVFVMRPLSNVSTNKIPKKLYLAFDLFFTLRPLLQYSLRSMLNGMSVKSLATIVGFDKEVWGLKPPKNARSKSPHSLSIRVAEVVTLGTS